MKWNELKRELFAKEPMCKLCRLRPASELHHAIVKKGDVRDRKKHKYLNVKENALEICADCHATAHDWKSKVKAYQVNCKRYGKEHMRNWYESLPLKIKEDML